MAINTPYHLDGFFCYPMQLMLLETNRWADDTATAAATSTAAAAAATKEDPTQHTASCLPGFTRHRVLFPMLYWEIVLFPMLYC